MDMKFSDREIGFKSLDRFLVQSAIDFVCNILANLKSEMRAICI